MKTTPGINLNVPTAAVVDTQKRSAYDSSLIAGIALIVLFLGLFVVEFTRILTLTGKVIHTRPAALQELVGNQSRSS